MQTKNVMYVFELEVITIVFKVKYFVHARNYLQDNNLYNEGRYSIPRVPASSLQVFDD